MSEFAPQEDQIIGTVELGMVGPGHPDYVQAVADYTADQERRASEVPAPPVGSAPTNPEESNS